jgi:hypothetical protein
MCRELHLTRLLFYAAAFRSRMADSGHLLILYKLHFRFVQTAFAFVEAAAAADTDNAKHHL